MRTPYLLLSLLAIALSLLLPRTGLADPTAGCPQARLLLHGGSAQQAEDAARACLTGAPDDVQTWTTLSGALAAQQKYAEALSWIGRARSRYPADADLALAQARTLFWTGDHEQAWQVLATLPEPALATPEDALFAARLAMLRQDPPEAARRFDRMMAVWPNDPAVLKGRARFRESQGQLVDAQADFASACLRQDAESCRFAEEIAERSSRLRVSIAPGYTQLRRDGRALPGWTLPAAVSARLTDDLTAGVNLEHRTRDFGQGALSDLYVQGALSVRLGGDLTLNVAAGTTVDRQFSPRFTAEVEPSLGLAGGWELMAKYWRLDFPDGGAHVLSPATLWQGERWNAYGRLFVALPDEGERNQSALLRVGRALGDDLTVYAGGGGGTGVDYLEIRQGAQGRFWFALAGAAYRLSWRHRITVDYVHRRESQGASLTQHLLSTGFELRL